MSNHMQKMWKLSQNIIKYSFTSPLAYCIINMTWAGDTETQDNYFTYTIRVVCPLDLLYI